MMQSEWAWLLLILGGFLAIGLFAVQIFLIRRLLKRTEGILGLQCKRKRVRNAMQKRDYALIAFDEKNEVFYWNGKYADSKAAFSFKAETGHAFLKLERGDITIRIYQNLRNISESRITSLIPSKMEINGRTIYNSSLLKDSGEKKLIYEILKDYFKNGVKRDIQYLSSDTRESIDALIFGYHSLKRFRAFLARSYPDFSMDMKRFRPRSVGESLLAFQRVHKTEDELEIEIRKAIFEEDYKRAAQIRDQIRKLQQP